MSLGKDQVDDMADSANALLKDASIDRTEWDTCRAYFVFALVSRFPIVASSTRNARAICSVVSPATSRSVSATCASRLSDG